MDVLLEFAEKLENIEKGAKYTRKKRGAAEAEIFPEGQPKAEEQGECFAPLWGGSEPKKA